MIKLQEQVEYIKQLKFRLSRCHDVFAKEQLKKHIRKETQEYNMAKNYLLQARERERVR
jgi:hypothetical protein